jgi:hypothetical protein
MPLTKIKSLLRQAYEAVQDATASHRTAGDDTASKRCSAIGRDILFEIDYLDDLLARLP